MKMLEHQKLMLKNIYQNRNFFVKEIKKSFRLLSKVELTELERWLRIEFSQNYDKEVQQLFLHAK
ncbi:MAG: hypothetical protein PF489_13400 [Salinivirgaceae bacterium]|jgi:hypothetical protein|nr:hypothetical protein [Salinivirgaceae bacterium]